MSVGRRGPLVKPGTYCFSWEMSAGVRHIGNYLGALTYRFKNVGQKQSLANRRITSSEMGSVKCPLSSSKMNGHLHQKGPLRETGNFESEKEIVCGWLSWTGWGVGGKVTL